MKGSSTSLRQGRTQDHLPLAAASTSSLGDLRLSPGEQADGRFARVNSSLPLVFKPWQGFRSAQ